MSIGSARQSDPIVRCASRTPTRTFLPTSPSTSLVACAPFHWAGRLAFGPYTKSIDRLELESGRVGCVGQIVRIEHSMDVSVSWMADVFRVVCCTSRCIHSTGFKSNRERGREIQLKLMCSTTTTNRLMRLNTLETLVTQLGIRFGNWFFQLHVHSDAFPLCVRSRTNTSTHTMYKSA